LFVNRSDISENIIIDAGYAKQVERLKEVRDILGTFVSDNLTNAENVLLVEGNDDKISLQKILPNMSDMIKKAIQNGEFIIDALDGAGNLSHKLSLYIGFQCKCHVLLDNDKSGVEAGEKAEKSGLISLRDITYTVCNGSPEAELEDCYKKEAYSQIITEKFGVNIDRSEFRNNKKWTERIGKCFLANGKKWDDKIKQEVKLSVANNIPSDPNEVFHPNKRSSIDSLVNSIETMIKGI
jgi:hypothetical protein